MTQKETYLITRDVAHMLNCSPDDVSLIAKQGKLKGTKQGRFWIFRLSDVEAFKRFQDDLELTRCS